MSATESWIATERGRLYAKSWNGAAQDKAPIILLHDSLGCVALWREFPEALARRCGRRVIAYDRLGFGRSDAFPGKLARDFVGDEAHLSLPALRAQMGVGNFIPFGHSVGGGMAVKIAGAFPEACRGLIVEAAQAFVEDRTIAGIRAAEADFAKPGQIERLKRYHGDKAAWVLRAWIENWTSPVFADWNLDAELPRVTCPMLVMHSEDDEFGSLAHPRRIAAMSGGAASLEIFPDAGHVPHREREDAVLCAVAKFLEKVG